jgi:hypothetical protein
LLPAARASGSVKMEAREIALRVLQSASYRSSQSFPGAPRSGRVARPGAGAALTADRETRYNSKLFRASGQSIRGTARFNEAV